MSADLEILREQIAAFADQAVRMRQLMERLRELLPRRLAAVKQNLTSGRLGATKALRQALVDETYLAHLEEFLSIQSNFRKSRVQYETHVMLAQARQSLRANLKKARS